MEAEPDADVAELLRQGAFAEAESMLRAALIDAPGAIADACLATTEESVSIPAWEGLDAELTRLAERHAVTAVGLDLSNHNDQHGGREWWDKEPCIEAAVYVDEPFAFADRVEWYVETVGLRRLNGELLRAEERGLATRLGSWWMHLRFRQAIARHVDAHGLALVVPVLVGSHDTGPSLVTVQRVPRISDHAATSRQINDARRARNLAAYRTATEEQVDRLREYRTTIQGFGLRDLVRLRPYIQNADAHLRLMCSASSQRPPSRSITRIRDAELEAIIDRWCADRRSREG